MSFQIENGVKVTVSAVLAVMLTLMMMTGIGAGTGPQHTDRAALNAHSPVATSAQHAG